MKKEILKEREITNEYGVITRYELSKEYKILPSGKEYNVEYVVKAGIGNMGYYRRYKRLSNALNDSYVEKYLNNEGDEK